MTPDEHRARAAAIAARAETFYEDKVAHAAVSSPIREQRVAEFHGMALLAHTLALLSAAPAVPYRSSAEVIRKASMHPDLAGPRITGPVIGDGQAVMPPRGHVPTNEKYDMDADPDEA